MSEQAKEVSPEEPQVPTILPLEVLDKSIGKSVKVLLTNSKEFKGTLAGFDDYVNIVMENVEEFEGNEAKGTVKKRMLLNGGQIAMLIPTV